MATLFPPFILCPLSESKQFLGMSSDKLENKAILTLGKNIAIRYHVLEQKQEVSWISSRHWFTSHVVYCADLDKYGTVIDYNTVIIFEESDSNLGSMKKYKFNKPVLELKPTTSLGTLVIFKNGAIKSLTYLISLSKPQLSALKLHDKLDISEESILNIDVDEKKSTATFVTGFNNEIQAKQNVKPTLDNLKRIKVLVQDLKQISSDDDSKTKFTDIVQDDGKFIRGAVILSSPEIGSSLMYLCSDGHLYRKSLSTNPSNTTDVPSSENKNVKVGSLEQFVSPANPVVIKSIDSSSIIIYGCDPSEEGAVIFVYDIIYNIKLTQQSLKLYSSPPLIEIIGNHILAPVGLHLLVLNLRLTKARLSSVVGKHQIKSTDIFEKQDPWVESWEGESTVKDSATATKIPNGHVEEEFDESLIDVDEVQGNFSIKNFEETYKLVKTLEQDGQPESMICGQIIPQMIEDQNNDALNWILTYFHDIPEECLVLMLKYAIGNIGNCLENGTELMDIDTDTDTNEENEKAHNYPDNPLINQIILRSFDQKELTKELRSIDFSIIKTLAQYFYCRLTKLWNNVQVVVKANQHEEEEEEEEYHTNNNNYELSQLLKWICVIFDAQYPQFVFNNEIKLIEKLFKFINEKFNVLNQIGSLESLLTSILTTKISYEPKPSPHTKYRIETVTFE